ncbi:MAG: SAGA HAT/Core module component [Pleopsidium flavum]|nr:MAG: SAGA HAT/Core module component [Pleopsidium flavum]
MTDGGANVAQRLADLEMGRAPVFTTISEVVSLYNTSTRFRERKLEADEEPTAAMAARNRPRGGTAKEDSADAHEERNMWNQIVADMKRLKVINARAAEVSISIKDMEASMGEAPSVAQMSALEALYREGLKLSEEEQKILNEEPNDVIKNVGILTALRNASESDPPRNPPVSKPRTTKRQKVDPPEAAAESPGPSPSVPIPTSKLKGSSVRSGSVPSVTAKDGKEAVIKAEDGAEGAKGTLQERSGKLTVGAEVAYKPSKEGDWIQCTIISISGEGNKKRYEVQDPEPDDRGAPGQIFKTSGAALIPISPPGAPLLDFPKDKRVLARYPETTTFYRAKVISMKKDLCRLNFEGEDEKDKETDVDRRYVLDVGNK